MSTAAIMEDARLMVRSLENFEARKGWSSEDARKRVSRNLGYAPGTLENLFRDRLKSIPDGFRNRARSLLIRAYEKEIGRLVHELEMLRLAGERSDCDDFQEAQASLEKAQKAVARLSTSVASSER